MNNQRPLTVEEICRKLKPVLGRKVDEIYLRYSLADSRDEREEIARILNGLYQRHLADLLNTGVLLEPPADFEVKGDYSIGKVSYAGKQLHDFALREHDWPRHVCISGMSGSGKTTIAFHVLKNFIDKDKPFLVFDWKKSFRPLVAYDDSLTVFTVGDDSVTNKFKMNILRVPKGISPKEWITILCDLFAESFSVSYGVHKVLIETLDELFEGWKIYEDYAKGIESKFYPTFEHVKRLLEDKAKKAKGREATWFESALRVGTVLTFGSFGDVVNYEGTKSVSVEDLFNKRVILEMNSLGNIEKKFLSEFVLTYIYKLKKARQNDFNSSGFDYAILVDEAHNIFLKDKTNFVRESVTDVIYREMREYGISLICLDQHVSKLSDTVKGNSACHIAFQQQLPEDMLDISRIMQLPDRRDLFSHLPVGSAIVKLSERYTSPFLIEIPFSDLRNAKISSDDLKSRLKSFVLGLQIEKNVDPEFNEALTNYEKNKGVFYMNRPYVPIKKEEQSIPNSPSVKFNIGPAKMIKDVEVEKKEKIGDSDLVPTHPPRETEFDSLRSPSGKMNNQKTERGIESNVKSSEKELSMRDLIRRDVKKKEFVEPIKVDVSKKFVEDKVVNFVGLSEKQKVLHEFVLRRVRLGESLTEIENTLKLYNIYFEGCSVGDIRFVVGKVRGDLEGNPVYRNDNLIGLENLDKSVSQVREPKNFNSSVSVVTKSKEIKEVRSFSDEEKFMNYLLENPEHRLSTVDLYKTVGLSTRKGNIVKKALLDKSLIYVKEVKYDKGWKKFINPVITK